MAEQISKHCWATPKCGIRTAQIHFPADGEYESKDSDFRFVIVRNPYARMASFYISKVINHIDPDDAPRRRGGGIPHIRGGKLDFSFEQMVPLVKAGKGADRHLKLQSDKMEITEMGTPAHDFHIVRCEHWTEDMKVVCEELDLDHGHYGHVWENRSETTDSITEYVGDKPAVWFIENGVPSDYSLFYNNHSQKTISQVYRADFGWLKDVYDTFEM